MAKKLKKENKKQKNNRHEKKRKERKEKKQIKNNTDEELDNQKESNKADFYLDDEDADLAYDSSELEAESMEEEPEMKENSMNDEEEEMSEHGSELDFKEEDYIPSEDEGDEEKEKMQSLSKKELKKLMDKVSEGSEIYITKFLILTGRLTNPDKEMNLEEGEENVLNQNKVINNIIKYFIKELPDILQLKMNSKNEEKNKSNNSLIKKYVSILVRYIKTCEQEMQNFIFYNIEKISPLIFQFNNFTEIILKLSIKSWSSTKEDELRQIILSFIKSLVTKKPKFFEYSIKIFYINYLNIAKEMNLNTFNHIKSLQDDIISILNYDLEKAYTTIFTFIRKLCIQLRATIVDKTTSSIKSIYNWQFVNSLILWARVIMKYISDPNIYLLIYPLIQTIIGVIRLNSNELYYLLRIRLVILLNGISAKSNIFIPTPMYILPILSSNYFIEKCKPIIPQKKPNEEKKSDKLEKAKINSRIVIYISLKIKKEELKIKQIRKDLLEECCDCLLEYLSINSNKICFTELADSILKEMRSALKNIYDKEFREIIKLRMEKIENQNSTLQKNLNNFFVKVK
jgi:nucleolar complex protein 2